MNRPRIRLLLGDLSRTGVPIVAERLLRWVAAEQVASVDVVAIGGGPLAPEIASVADSLTVLEPDHGRSAVDAIGVGLAVLGHPRSGRTVRQWAWRTRLARLSTPDVVVMHGAGAWPLVATVSGAIPLVVHLHELPVGMDRSIPSAERAALYQRAVRILAVCQPVAELAEADGAPPERLSIVPGLLGPPPQPMARSVDQPPVVVGMGAPGWRKGTDRFVALAHQLARTHPTARCVWVGGTPQGAWAPTVTAPMPVEWIPERADPWAPVAGGAVFVVPSREDALPLVALEAAQRHLPVVCAATGGLTELFGADRGRVVPGHDLLGLHRAVSDAIDDPVGAEARAEAAALYVVDQFSPERVGPLWWSMVNATVATYKNGKGQR